MLDKEFLQKLEKKKNFYRRGGICSAPVRWYVGVYYTRCHQKITIIFKFRELRIFDLRIFFCYVGTHVCLYMFTMSAILDCQFVFDRYIQRLSCFGVLSDFLLFEKMDQRNCIKFCVKNYIKCAKTLAFGESTMSGTQVQLWYNRFKEDLEDVNDYTRPGSPSTSTTDENIEAVKKLILDNRRITIREVADDDGISFGSCQAIFTDVLLMKRAAAKVVPKTM